ncbi:fatty acid coa synthetase family [Anaeramoeba ignava]|uniref:Fatty acid coa synthetase family n=1 Tax=Anaeramoeba ignava TaxID=1746090 RepID=A0A9Q0LDD4_ANAIG|nr:fatty acid coa synthetase family [Anaeramoeba ignava]
MDFSKTQFFWFCDLCRKEIEEGQLRYHCSECENFDLCPECFKKTGHNHIMYKDRYHDYTHQENIILRAKKSLSNCYVAIFQEYSTRQCFGIFNKKGNLSWISFREVFFRILTTVSLFQKLCGESLPSESSENVFVVICGRSCLQWYISDFACVLLGLSTVPIHHTSSNEKIIQIIQQTHPILVVTEESLIPRFNDILLFFEKEKIDIKFKIASFDEKSEIGINPIYPEKIRKKIRILKQKLKNETNQLEKNNLIYQIEKVKKPFFVEKINLFFDQFEPIIRDPKKIFTIVFTSGSTGSPKGAVFTNEMWSQKFDSHKDFFKPIVILAFSSLSQMMDRASGITVPFMGGRVAISRGVDHLFEDLQITNPISFSAPPRIFDVIRIEFENELFGLAKNVSSDQEKSQIENELRKKFSKKLGSRVKMIISGGAMLSQITKDFLKKTFDQSLFTDSFGTTEAGDIAGDTELYDDVEVKLEPCEELGYDGKETGEICVKTKNMIDSYFNNPEETKKAFTSDGYFRTGDIGRRVSAKRFVLIDRKKNIVKLAQATFVSPTYLESVFSDSPFFNYVYIHASPGKDYVVSVVILSEVGRQNKVDFFACQKIFRELAQQKKLQPYEIPRAVHIDSTTLFSIENGLLTPSLKVNRPNIERYYKEIIDKMYKDLESNPLSFNLDFNSNHENTENQSNFIDPSLKIRKEVTSVIKSILSVQEILPNLSFYDQGADSLSVIRLRSTISNKYHIDLPQNLLYKPLEDLITFICNPDLYSGFQKNEQIDWSKETDLSAYIDSDKKLSEISKHLKNERIFLTGCTGFIGIHLLWEFVQLDFVKSVACLIRCKDEESGLDRVRGLLETAGLESPLMKDYEEKISIIPGDLSLPNFGLAKAKFFELGNQIDVIFHSGALVDSFLPYSILRAPNVLGTIEVLKLSLIPEQKTPIHYFSTVSVFFSSYLYSRSKKQKMLNEDTNPFEDVPNGQQGYTQSKWVAENLVNQFKKAYNPMITIWRPASVFCSTLTGFLNPKDMNNMLITGFALLGYAPDEDMKLNLVPVDFCAKAVCEITLKNPSNKLFSFSAFHLSNPFESSLWFVLDCLIKNDNFQIKKIPLFQFRRKLLQIEDEKHPLRPFIVFFQQDFLPDSLFFESKNLQSLLPKGMNYPKITNEVISVYSKFIQKSIKNQFK